MKHTNAHIDTRQRLFSISYPKTGSGSVSPTRDPYETTSPVPYGRKTSASCNPSAALTTTLRAETQPHVGIEWREMHLLETQTAAPQIQAMLAADGE